MLRQTVICCIWAVAFFVAQAPAIAQETFCLLKGNVFTPDGRSFAGARVVVDRTDIPEKDRKRFRREGSSDRSGEFAFRLAAGPAKYKVTVDAKGFAPEHRELEFIADERLDVSIVLKK